MSGELANCFKCGNVFRRVTSPLCPNCLKEDQDDLERVKEYLRFNRGASMEQTVQDTGIETSRIVTWIELEHLILAPESKIEYPCENGCGTLIRSGKYCRNCLGELSETFKPIESIPERKNRGYLSKE